MPQEIKGITQKSLQRSEYERTKLIGTVIITPPAKEIKKERKDNVIKTEKEWLKLPKNIPLDNISLNDLNVHPRLIHKDGSICHSKTYWKSLNKNPPLREFELPDLFSDDEESTQEKTQERSNTSKTMEPEKSKAVDDADVTKRK